MSFLVRKITMSRWPRNNYGGLSDISADTLTNVLNTKNNELSFWKAENEEEIKEIGASFFSRLNGAQSYISLVAIPYEELESISSLKNSPKHGDTAIPKLKIKHYDLCNLTGKSLCATADAIAKRTSNLDLNQIIDLDKDEAITVLQKMLTDGEVDKSLLGDFMKGELLNQHNG